MNFKKFIAGQLRKPAGFFGKNILLRILNRMNLSINTLALEVMQLAPDDHVLEIGFGGGDLIKKISSKVTQGKVFGIDFSNDVVESCTKRFDKYIKEGKLELHCADAAELPFDSEKFTKVCTVNTIYFWADPNKVLSQIYRVLKKDGKLIICLRSRSSLKNDKIVQYGFTLYEPEEVSTLLTKSGFRDVHIIRIKHANDECTAVEGKK